MVELENKFNLYFLESYKHIFYRNYQFKEFLREKYKNSLNNKDMKVVIISHGGYCKIGTSKKAYELENKQWVNVTGIIRVIYYIFQLDNELVIEYNLLLEK
jgi:hypothetical protein